MHCIAIQTYSIKATNSHAKLDLNLPVFRNKAQDSPSRVSTNNHGLANNNEYDYTREVSNPTVTLNRILPNVFRRPYLSVSPETPFLQLATFLAIGHQVYVDGLIVATDKKLVGRIGGKQILECLLNIRYDDWQRVKASELMVSNSSSVELDSSLNTLLELFAETKFALAPITNNGSLIGSIGIRDLLPLIFKSNLDTPITEIGSPIVRLQKDETLRDSIDIMLKRNIRNLVISNGHDHYNNNGHYIINDRKILEFIFSYEGKKIMARGTGSTALNRVDVNSVDMIPVSYISETQTVNRAAKLLMNINTPALLSINDIVTPWDVVMKTIGKENSSYV